jgi:tellurite resistance protein
VSGGDARRARIGTLADQLESRRARELAYAFAFLVSVADVKLTPQETAALEEFQHALGLEYSRATDLVVLLTDVVAADP